MRAAGELLQGLSLQGPFQDAREFLDDNVKQAFSLQNPDGSFSTEWLLGRGNRPDADRKVQTTGHILSGWLTSYRKSGCESRM